MPPECEQASNAATIQLNRKRKIPKQIPRMIRTPIFCNRPRQPSPPHKLQTAHTTNTNGAQERFGGLDETKTSKIGIGARPISSQVNAKAGLYSVLTGSLARSLSS